MLTGWDCSISGQDLLNAAKDIISLNPAGFHALKDAADDAQNFKDGARAVAQGVCQAVWTNLELTSPIFSFVYNLVTMFADQCGMLQNLNPAISLGITLDAGVGSFGFTANLGAEFGIAIDKNGNRMCYLGYCVSRGFAISLPPAPPASADVGVMMSFWGDAGSIPGTLSTIEFSMEAQFASLGIALDLIYMYAGNIGDFLGIGISAEVGPGKAAVSGGTSLMVGNCDTPLCLTTCGEDCGGGRPTCGYVANAAAARSTSAVAVELQGGNDGSARNLQACIGECDGDVQCAPGLRCFERNGRTPIPGCAGLGNHNWDYCYDPQTPLAGGETPTYDAQMTSVAHPPSVGQGSRGTSDGMGILQIRSVDGKCLHEGHVATAASNRVHNQEGSVYMATCNIHERKQHWVYDRATNQIKSREGNICLDGRRGNRGGVVRMSTCDTSDRNQWFEIDAGINRIKNTDNQQCLAATFYQNHASRSQRKIEGGRTAMYACRERYDQMWAIQRCEVHDDLADHNGWHPHNGQYGGGEIFVSGNTCMVSGVIDGDNWGRHVPRSRWQILGTLPTNCRPSKRLTFNLNNQAETARVDVLTNGQMRYITGGTGTHNWLSLTGMTFAPGNPGHQAVTYHNGWHAYTSSGFGGGEVTVSNGVCMVSGFIRHRSSMQMGHVVTLPTHCRPNKKLLFNLNQHDETVRVDVRENGQVRWRVGGSRAWLSLTGITFAPGNPAHEDITYNNGWRAYGGTWGGGEVTVRGGSCLVSGLIKPPHRSTPRNSDWGHVATLPENCRPNKRLVFNLNTCSTTTPDDCETTRVDVKTNGHVTWVAGRRGTWLSLAGITFMPRGAERCI